MISSLCRLRLSYRMKVPHALEISTRVAVAESDCMLSCSPIVQERFPKTANQKALKIAHTIGQPRVPSFTLGVVFSGGPAPGGHNVIAGLFDALAQRVERPLMVGFLGGPSGIVDNKAMTLEAEGVNSVRNQGGFDLLGTGRTKIETEEQLFLSLCTVKARDLDALVIIGGDDSNTNAAVLAEYFAQHNCKTAVLGVPKTIDGDLKNPYVDLSFGFDTATRVYAELIGNIAKDAASARKYYHCIRLMGRSASHVALECALRTRPNIALISEEIRAKQMTLAQIADTIAKTVEARKAMGRRFGVILLPEGLLEFVPQVRQLIDEVNRGETLSSRSEKLLQQLPETIRRQLLSERDAHGNVPVSSIETEKLLMEMVVARTKISGVTHFLGYEGRCALPTNFDSDYAYALGLWAAHVAIARKSGYLCGIKGLHRTALEWSPVAVPLTSLLDVEMRKGQEKPVIAKTLVDLQGKAFDRFAHFRQSWILSDDYAQPGPIQYFLPDGLEERPLTLQLET